MYSVNTLSQIYQDPRVRHWNLATLETKLIYRKTNKPFMAYTNSSDFEDIPDPRWQFGVFFVQACALID